MSKTRTTLTIDEEVLRAVKVRAARLGNGDCEVIEEALRHDLGLELLDRLWAGDIYQHVSVPMIEEARSVCSGSASGPQGPRGSVMSRGR